MYINWPKLRYIIADFCSALIAWTLFFIFRKVIIERTVFHYPVPIELDISFFEGLIIIPICWVLFYYVIGFYQNINHKSITSDFGSTFQTSFLGANVLFFAVILDDIVGAYQNYYYSFIALFCLQFVFTFLFRNILTSIKNTRLRRGSLRFNTLVVGANAKNTEFIEEVKAMPRANGIFLKGYVVLNDDDSPRLDNLPCLGSTPDICRIIEDYNISDIILAEPKPNERVFIPMLNTLYDMRINIMASPTMYEYMSSRSHITALIGTPLIAINLDGMPFWQLKMKALMDYSFAFFALLMVSPICLFLALGVKISSKGPIIYSHIRIGKNGRPFYIYKFRSMYTDAEKHGPALSTKHDNRMTPFGRLMRRTKLDELPNFFNVLKGDMSLVGPRPERQFFIDQIVEKTPSYLLVQRMKPGITSLGQVKYGYAENIEQMLKRLKFDLVYLNNMSLWLDIRILFNTFLLMFRGRGI
jgi:exopolysaccharide biosynthesis polyprenyl glycosylphosphotransferase